MFSIVVLSIFIVSIVGQNENLKKSSRIDCFPESESSYSNYSKETCLARHCLFDDDAKENVIQCYLSSSYGYRLEEPVQQIQNGLQLKLKRNQAIQSPFPHPIDNVLLKVEFYTNEILRIRFFDAENHRYEVK